MARKPAPETFDDLLTSVAGKLTFEQVAEKAGVSPRTLHRIRTGESKAIRRSTILAIATALGVDVGRVRAAIGHG
jgi:DNA-binding Xre family transcriptional regulator